MNTRAIAFALTALITLTACHPRRTPVQVLLDPSRYDCTGDWLSSTFSGPGYALLNFTAPVPEGSVGLIAIGPPPPVAYMIYLAWNRLELHVPAGGEYHVRVTFGQAPDLCADLNVSIAPEG